MLQHQVDVAATVCVKTQLMLQQPGQLWWDVGSIFTANFVQIFHQACQSCWSFASSFLSLVLTCK